MGNMINVLGISELKKMVEKMANEDRLPYMGISGVDVPSSIYRDYKVPYGAYVKELDMDSPAMLAGIQQGDVITVFEDKTINKFNDYSAALLETEPGQTVELTILRQAQEEYKEMKFTIEVGEHN